MCIIEFIIYFKCEFHVMPAMRITKNFLRKQKHESYKTKLSCKFCVNVLFFVVQGISRRQ